MKARPLLVASALFVSLTAYADEPIEPTVDVCSVTTNTKGPPQAPCEESVIAEVETPEGKDQAPTLTEATPEATQEATSDDQAEPTPKQS